MTREGDAELASSHGAAGSSVQAWHRDTVPRFPPPRPASMALGLSPEPGAGPWLCPLPGQSGPAGR